MRPWSKPWFEDCMRWRGRVLEGRYRHWCMDWDGLPVDETTPEHECCTCFTCKCGEPMKYIPNEIGALHMFDDVFECPKRHLWNFWKHNRWFLNIGTEWL